MPTRNKNISSAEVVLSVIVPFKNSEKYILQTLMPFLHEQEIELVLVDDASTDNSNKIINEFVEKSSVKIQRVTGSGLGPGNARNLGLRHSHGSYIAFVDSDDLVEVGVLKDICCRMTKAQCDLAIFNHRRLYRTGVTRENLRTDLLQSRELCCNDESKFDLIYNFNVAWNKVYKKSFIKSHGLEFPIGIYEDIPWAILALVLAPRVLVESQMAYTYRQHPESTLKEKGEAHLVILDQYQRAIDSMQSLGVNKTWVSLTKIRAIEHAFLISYKRSRMPYSTRGKLFYKLKEFVFLNSCFWEIVKSKRFSKTEKISLFIRSRLLLETPFFKKKFRRFFRKLSV